MSKIKSYWYTDRELYSQFAYDMTKFDTRLLKAPDAAPNNRFKP